MASGLRGVDFALHVACSPDPGDSDTLFVCLAVIHALLKGSDTWGLADIAAEVVDMAFNSEITLSIGSVVAAVVGLVDTRESRRGCGSRSAGGRASGHCRAGAHAGTGTKEFGSPDGTVVRKFTKLVLEVATSVLVSRKN